MKEYSDEIKQHIKALVDHYQLEDRAVRERQIRLWRKLKLYWSGFTRIWYDSVAHDWRVWNEEEDQEDDNSYYDKPVNVFKAYLESIIAALSITIPTPEFLPDDADNSADIATAKAGQKIYDLVSRYNSYPLKWLHAIYIYCTEGLVAAYNYSEEDESYGTYEEKEYKDETIDMRVCAICQTQLDDSLFPPSGQDGSQNPNQNLNQQIGDDNEEFIDNERDEFGPDYDDAMLHDLIINKDEIVCPSCGAAIDPELQKEPVIVTRLVGTTTKPKTRQCVEVYGGLYVKVPNYAMRQKDCPYIGFSYETHYSAVIDRYEKLRDFYKKGIVERGPLDPYEAWGRLSTQYNGETPTNNVTVRNWWFRPSAFQILSKDVVDDLKREFPDGIKTVFVNDTFCEASNECLDDCWTLSHNPLSDYLHHDPLGLLLTSIQDITNDLVSLTLQTIEQGIPQTFVDPNVLDLDAYRNAEALPGGVYPTKPVAGNKNISESFATIKTATLGTEVMPFAQRVQDMGQLVSGALPSLFGGTSDAGSKTASEYSMSRAQAQQRLHTPYQMLSYWWKDINGKVVTSYIKDAIDDERFVKKDEAGNFINVNIRKIELEGKIGSVSIEPSDSLPVSTAQIKDVLMKLIELQNPFILEAMSAPENIPLVKRALGLNDLVIPGEADRRKQYDEIEQLLASEPLDQMTPSVAVDPDLDNHQIEAEICRRWLVSETGRITKVDNPQGYLNVLLHFKQHMMFVQMQAAQELAASAESQTNSGGGGNPPKNKSAPKGTNNVVTPIQ